MPLRHINITLLLLAISLLLRHCHYYYAIITVHCYWLVTLLAITIDDIIVGLAGLAAGGKAVSLRHYYYYIISLLYSYHYWPRHIG